MRSPYEDYTSTSNNRDTDNTIPYHARENSQPFSYGQIYKTSTPLRNGRTNDQYRDAWNDIDSIAKKNSFDLNSVTHKYNSVTAANTAQAGTESNMIKAQPRLTSPLLVRKTLHSRSPTRNSANTIANTYHYSYGNGVPNGNINKYNTNVNTNTNNRALRKTPTRNDFEELLRERREKVYNEYRSTTHDIPSRERQQLSTAHASNGQNKYNFDFEFNLNLDELPPRRSNTMERSSLQYRTHDIPVATSVERNYHTISSSKARETFGRQERERPPLETNYSRHFQLESTLHDRYGNENASGYSYDYGSDAVDAAVGGRNRIIASNMSPIYATSSKQKQIQTTSSYRSTHDITRSEPESTTTDYAAGILAAPSTSTTLVSRPETPAFPVTPRTPYGANNGYNGHYTQPRSPTPQQTNYQYGKLPEVHNFETETIYQTNYRPPLNSSLSLANGELQEVAPHLVKFAKDSSRFWYKPNLSREEAISLLLHATPGTFVVRDSTTYKNAYGLVVRVAQPPPGTSSGKQDELVRHFLIEPTTRGVRLKGCANEPVFTSLSALVYQHSINALALPCALLIPEQDLVPPLLEHTPAQRQLLTQGAACNVLWLYSCDTESLTGEEAIRKAIRLLYTQKPFPIPTEVHFKVTQQGITLTDNTRKKFFRKHYVADMISYCAIDPDHRTWTMQEEDGSSSVVAMKKTIFAFVARRSPSSMDNQCHVFCDMAINQPASAIVSFANKTLPTEKQKNYVL